MKNQIIRFSLFILPIFLMCLYNWRIDSYHLFRNTDTEIMVQELKKGKTIALNAQNRRVLLAQWTASLDSLPDIVVLGSSRSMQFCQDMFPNKLLMNNSVSAGNVYDMMAFLTTYHNRFSALPKQMIICMDLWHFSDDVNSNKWYVNREAVLAFIKKNNFKKPESFLWNYKKHKLNELLSVQYLLDNLQIDDSWHAAIQIDSNNYRQFPDGSFSSPYSFTHPTSSQLQQKALSYSQKSLDENFDSISTKQTDLIRSLLNYLLDNGVSLTIYIPPYHPETYQLITKEHKGIILAEKKLKQLCEQLDITCLSQSYINNTILKPNDFYDGVHLKRSALKKYWKSLPHK